MQASEAVEVGAAANVVAHDGDIDTHTHGRRWREESWDGQ